MMGTFGSSMEPHDAGNVPNTHRKGLSGGDRTIAVRIWCENTATPPCDHRGSRWHIGHLRSIARVAVRVHFQWVLNTRVVAPEKMAERMI
eukprot:CAMPEP_0119128328 /NCGR_PEP_ID=MMETSP1310-20130426/6530_1 /TAXON_ID=464262 /ORGANISM="Genus nov. species nov., Strain RCC2339" /LENGTH=89 /DNA_ID=CAMNT_0007118659 /DNA_START=586 /DNA_END=855 /DNA_ORIENTATION=-